MAEIFYDSLDLEYKSPFGAVKDGEQFALSVAVSRRLNAKAVYLCIYEEEKLISENEMGFFGLKKGFERYCLSLSLKKGLYFYCFRITTYNGDDIYCKKNGQALWQLTVYTDTFTSLDSVKGKTIYQIFPDRFCKAKIHYTEKVPKFKKWGDIPNHVRNTDGTLDTTDFFGGNIIGITSKLEYLYRLGIGIIYINPIFEAHTNHRYDTADYEKIDPILGTEDDFRQLCEKASEYGIKIIIDGVFSHTGDDSRYFNKYSNYKTIGAYQSKDSPYFKWYKFNTFPDDYSCWWGVKILPETNETELTYLNYITGENGIAEKWLNKGAFGWRLDVADELPDCFLDAFAARVKKTNPNAFIIGEVWEDASNKISYGQRRRYLLGGQLDSVMNYVFRDAILHFIKERNAVEFNKTVMTVCENYPSPVLHSMMNILGTHDTERILTVLGDKKLVKLAFILLYCLPGLPCIYYGDEAGMTGGKDPLNRLCYPYGEEDAEMLEFITKIGQKRKNSPSLSDGEYKCIYAEDSVIVFSRSNKDQSLVCCVNAGEKAVTVRVGEKEISVGAFCGIVE